MRPTFATSRFARSYLAARRRIARLARPLIGAIVIAGVSVTAVLGGSAAGASISAESTSIAARPFEAGERGVAEARLPAAAATAQVERATRTATLLGLPAAARRSATRVVDRFAGRTYDEIAEYDGRDRLLSLQRFDTDGRLIAAVRFGWRGDGRAALAGAAAARLRAERVVATLGLEAAGSPRVVAAPSNAGWTVAWDRTVAGIPVPGDGLRIQLWPDGSVHGLTRAERALAARPAVLIAEGRARTIVGGQLDGWFPGDRRRDVTVTGLGLAWVPPNDTFAPGAADAPSAVLRLAWVARVTTSGALTENLRALEVYLDAGDGSVLGGDILQ